MDEAEGLALLKIIQEWDVDRTDLSCASSVELLKRAHLYIHSLSFCFLGSADRLVPFVWVDLGAYKEWRAWCWNNGSAVQS